MEQLSAEGPKALGGVVRGLKLHPLVQKEKIVVINSVYVHYYTLSSCGITS